jgi:hypothetical protein
MTQTQARTAANIMIASAGVAAAYVVLTRPRLRRLAFQAVRIWLGASVPAYLLEQTRRAWVQSGQAA